MTRFSVLLFILSTCYWACTPAPADQNPSGGLADLNQLGGRISKLDENVRVLNDSVVGWEKAMQDSSGKWFNWDSLTKVNTQRRMTDFSEDLSSFQFKQLDLRTEMLREEQQVRRKGSESGVNMEGLNLRFEDFRLQSEEVQLRYDSLAAFVQRQVSPPPRPQPIAPVFISPPPQPVPVPSNNDSI